MNYEELRRKTQEVVEETYADVEPDVVPSPGMILVGGEDPGIMTFYDTPYENVLEMASSQVTRFEPERWGLWTLSATDEGAETVTMQVTEGDHDENWQSFVMRTESAAPKLGDWQQIPTGGRS